MHYTISREAKQNRTNVINDRDGKNVSKFIMEEIYQSRWCQKPNVAKHTLHNNNPHNGTYSNGQYMFDFPSPWFNSPTLNKAIALRRIDCPANFYEFEITLKQTKLVSGIKMPNPLITSTRIHIEPSNNIVEALSLTCLTLNNNINETLKAGVPSGGGANKYGVTDEYLRVSYLYNYNTSEVTFYWSPITPSTSNDLLLECVSVDDDFSMLLNRLPLITPADLTINFPVGTVDVPEWRFSNVWNRQNLFIHASLVTYTAYHYLGRDNEFYTKPSKIYDFNFGQQQFWIQTSFDGANFVALPYENFIIELALILDARNYQSN
jgi:hypothetical protein